MDLIELIKKRRSVRDYNGIDIDNSVLEDIKQYLTTIKSPFPHNVDFVFSEDTSVYKSKAKNFVVCYGDNTNQNHVAIGYILGKLDLYIQGLGLGSLFLGMGKNKQKNYLFTLVFGNTDEKFRDNLEAFKRIPISDFSNTTNEYTNLVRLTPTAVNNMPFQIVCKQNTITINKYVRGLIGKLINAKKMCYIDIGILLAYTEIYYNSNGYTLSYKEIDDNYDEIVIEFTKGE
jgi:hypothetical protein